MPTETPSTTLQIDEDMALQRKLWRIERLGWLAMALIIAAAGLGLFGDGPIARTTTRDAETGSIVDYPRFHRRSASTTVTVRVANLPAGSNALFLELDEQFLKVFRIHSIRPDPAQSIALAGKLRLGFETGGVDPTIHFNVTAERAGLYRPSLTIDNRSPLRMSIFVFP